VTYAPSASSLAELAVPSLPGKRELLAFGDPNLRLSASNASAGNIVRGIDEKRGMKFTPLPNTRQEVESIASLYPPNRRTTYLGSAATKSALKTEPLSAYRRLHFAAHAFVDDENPARSGIALSPEGADDVGALSSAKVGWFNWQTKTYETAAEFQEQLEVLSLIGDIALKDGKPMVHAHLIVGRKDGTAHGGHLLEAHVRPTLEVVLTESAHLRGLAYLRLHKGVEAATEFQKILDHKGASWGSTWLHPNWALYYSLSYLGLARASAVAGDTAKAGKAFQDFFELWKDADPDIPILKKAKAECAKLQ
jgi:hypothetical protein